MGTFWYVCLIRRDFVWHLDEKFNAFANFIITPLALFGMFIGCVAMLPFLIIENIFILPSWVFYNMMVYPKYRKKYLEFIGYNIVIDTEQKHWLKQSLLIKKKAELDVEIEKIKKQIAKVKEKSKQQRSKGE